MTLEIEVRLKSDGDTTILAHETAHVCGITPAQTSLAGRIARVAMELITGEKIILKPLKEHLKD